MANYSKFDKDASSSRFSIKTFFLYVILVIWAVVNLFPVYWMFDNDVF